MSDNLESIEDNLEYQENMSLRNNVKLVGFPESDESESWDQSEEILKSQVKDVLGIEEELDIERAHRVGQKIFEKLMYRFLEIHKVLYSLQFGFQENHSIDHALVSLTEAVRNTLDSKRFGCDIFIDLQKAFDTVNHASLLSKLEHYGVGGCALEWFRSYLSNRNQYVSVKGAVARAHPRDTVS